MATQNTLRGEIQGLRAVAVMLVLTFHLWPSAVPGGYVGVDVFFVISGYLIVGTLARSAEAEGFISLRQFYAKRIRRLLPAATVVLAACLVGTVLFLPEPQWQDTFLQTAASAAYVENWYLAWSAVDYLAADNAASPVQHYWSLSIEEQFYVVWPILAMSLTVVARRTSLSSRHLMAILVAIIFVSSLSASVLATRDGSSQAYFLTHTRSWELALGGIFALWLPQIRLDNALRCVLATLGVGAIVVSAFAFSATTPFPGLAALVPTLGAAMVILAGDVRIGGFRGLNWAPLRYLGDISYSLYLWHWPIIVFYLASSPGVGFVDGLVLMGVAVLLSHLSYHYVEERFRHPKSNLEWRPIAMGAGSALCLVIASGAAYLALAARPIPTLAQSDASYPGPATLIDGVITPNNVPLVPAAVDLKRDKAPVYDSGCHQDQDDAEINSCIYGDPDGDVSVAVVGSSHSVNWLPTIDALGKKNGWRVISVTKSGCGFRSTGDQSCLDWVENVFRYFEERPVRVVFIAEFSRKSITSGEEELIAARWRRFNEIGISVAAIVPTPQLDRAAERCLPDQIDDCTLPRSIAIRPNTVLLAAASLPDVFMIDMNNAICSPQQCGPVVGNIAVYRDTSHLTSTYAVALAPYLESELLRLYPDLLPVSAPFSNHAPVSEGAMVMCRPSRRDATSDFSRQYEAAIRAGTIEMGRGDWENQVEDFESWTGTVQDGQVKISGTYRQGSGGIKEVKYDGVIRGNTIVAQGTRGGRLCSMFWPIGPGNN